MNNNRPLGIILIALSIVFFGLFVWWGTTEYKPPFGIGIIFTAFGTFITGIYLVKADDKE